MCVIYKIKKLLFICMINIFQVPRSPSPSPLPDEMGSKGIAQDDVAIDDTLADLGPCSSNPTRTTLKRRAMKPSVSRTKHKYEVEVPEEGTSTRCARPQ